MKNIFIFCLVIITLFSNFKIATSEKKCDYTNPIYAAILARDAYQIPSEIVYTDRPFIKTNDNKTFYFDEINNPCYFKLAKNLNKNDPRLNLYSYYSDFNDYRNSFTTTDSTDSEDKADGFIISMRGTKDQNDVMNDLQLYFKMPPSFMFDFIRIIDRYRKDNPRSLLLEKLSYFVGHSLGGSLAELLAIYYDKNAISFDAPGTTRHLKDIIMDKFKIPNEKYERIRNNNIISFISMPNIINSTFSPSFDKSFVIFSDPNPDCNQYFSRQWDFSKFKMKYKHIKISDQAKNMNGWHYYYHMIYVLRDSLINNYKGTGYEIISEHQKKDLNLLTYVRDPKIDRFFSKYYSCDKLGVVEKTYETFKESRIKEYEKDMKSKRN